jgi:hypothetical protein
MALRVKQVEIGGTKYRIGNALVGPWADYERVIARINKGEELNPGEVTESMLAFALSALKRGDPEASIEQIRGLDGDDLQALVSASLAWYFGREAKTEGKSSSP